MPTSSKRSRRSIRANSRAGRVMGAKTKAAEEIRTKRPQALRQQETTAPQRGSEIVKNGADEKPSLRRHVETYASGHCRRKFFAGTGTPVGNAGGSHLFMARIFQSRISNHHATIGTISPICLYYEGTPGFSPFMTGESHEKSAIR